MAQPYVETTVDVNGRVTVKIHGEWTRASVEFDGANVVEYEFEPAVSAVWGTGVIWNRTTVLYKRVR